MKMWTWVIGVSMMSLLWVAGCNQKKTEGTKAEAIKIGAILPLTGDAAEYGNNDKNGIDLAVEQVNAAGGIKGRKLEVVYEDCQMDAKLAVAAINKLGMQNVPAVIDDAVSTLALAMVPVANSNKQIIISTGASNPSLSGISPYFFRIWNSDAEEGVFAARFAFRDLGVKNVAILYINNDYGLGLSKVFSEEFAKVGGVIVGTESFEKDSKEFRGQITKIKKKKLDAVYLVGYAAQTGIAAKQLLEQGIKTRIIGTVAMEDPQFVKLAGAASEAVLYPFPEQPTGDVVANFKQAFKQKYGKEPGLLCDCGYDAANLLVQALQQDAKTGEEIRSKLNMVKNYKGASGVISFDEKGDVHKPMVVKAIKGGKFVPFVGEQGVTK
jgi:branched-chain amino acid transport system substrate-binding protein